MHNHAAEGLDQECRLAPGLSGIVAAAEATGWSVRWAASFVELIKPGGHPQTLIGYQVNWKWWCRDVLATAGTSKAYRVTAPALIKLLGLPTH